MLVYPDFKAFLLRPIVPKIICACLAIFIFWSLIDTLHMMSALRHAESMPTKSIPISEPKEGESSITEALNRSLFGAYLPPQSESETIKQSMLNIEIVGILFAEEEKDSQVLIKTGENEEQIFRVGDTLPGGVSIKRITAEGILMEHNGGLERLSLPKQDLKFESPPETMSPLPN